MDTMIVAESRTERMIRAFMEGAESGMVEVRGYGLTAEEREEARREAVALYGESIKKWGHSDGWIAWRQHPPHSLQRGCPGNFMLSIGV